MTAVFERQEILRRFEALLDSALASEEPPAGIDGEIFSSVTAGTEDETRRCDSYALWSAMAALTQEIKLQGRAFQELNLTLTAQAAKIAEDLRTVYAERERTLQREADRRSRKEALRAFIDLRDRLVRSLASAQAHLNTAVPQRGWRRILAISKNESSKDAVAALLRGYQLGLERLDQTLDEFSAHEIHCLGQVFDPHTMNAIETEETSGLPAGTVLEVYLSGYYWNGELFRPAQVKVSRAPATPP